MSVQAIDELRTGGSTRPSGRLAIVALVLAVSTADRPCQATPIFVPYGQALSIDSATGDAYAVQGGTLDLKAGGHVLALSTSDDDRSSITISGGQVDAGIQVGLGSLTASGGVLRGFAGVPGGSGGDALEVTKASARITGGTFIGGDSPGANPGAAITAHAGTWNGQPFLSTLNIDGGTFSGGNAPGGKGFSLNSLGNTTVAGGDFQSPIRIDASYGGTTEFLGSDLAYNDSTHVLSGILRNGDPIDALITLVGDTTFAGSGSGVRFLSGSTPAGGDPSPPGTTTPPPDPVPEPTAFVVFGLMTVAGLARRRVGRAA